jgi:hypothetical protein
MSSIFTVYVGNGRLVSLCVVFDAAKRILLLALGY